MMRRLIGSLRYLGLCFLKHLPKKHSDRRELSRRDPLALFIKKCLHAPDCEMLDGKHGGGGRFASGVAADIFCEAQPQKAEGDCLSSHLRLYVAFSRFLAAHRLNSFAGGCGTSSVGRVGEAGREPGLPGSLPGGAA